MLQMEDTPEAYLMLLGRPWFKQAKVHQDWGNNTLTITADTNKMTLSIEKQVMVHPSQRPCNFDNTYDWEGGLIDGDKECLYLVVPELCLVGKISPKELKFLPKVYVGMAQRKDDINYPFWYYQHEHGKTLIIDESTDIMIKNKQITRWTFTIDEQLNKLNLGTNEEPRMVLVNVILSKQFQVKVKQLLTKFKDVFAWSYKELKGIPRSICEYKIELTTNAHPIKQQPY